MAPITSDKFLANLEKSRLFTPEQLALVQRATEKSSSPTAIKMARYLVKRELCTTWQAQRLLEGNTAFFLANYKFVDHIGRGAMGSVFKAEHAVMGRVVALKVLTKARLAHPNALTRFQREVEAMAALDHPNIVTAYDAGQAGRTHYLVMEYIDGVDLNAWIEGYGRIKIPWACEIIRQSALGLDHAHQQGMIHRDIKPANILVAWKDGMPVAKLLDLGLARIYSEEDDEESQEGFDLGPKDDTRFGLSETVEAQLTHAGTILGTPDYLAPEQIISNHTVDGRADIFSLGCTLFKLLTGDLPYSGPDLLGKLEARVNPNAPPPLRLRTLLPQADAGLEEVIDKMVRRDEKQRFQNAWEVAEALAPYSEIPDERARDYVPLHAPRPDSSEVGSSQMALEPRLQGFLSQLATEDPSVDANHQNDTQADNHQVASTVSQSRPSPAEPGDEPGPVRIVPVSLRRQRRSLVRWTLALALALVGSYFAYQRYLSNIAENPKPAGADPLGSTDSGQLPQRWPVKTQGLLFAVRRDDVLDGGAFKIVGNAEAHRQGYLQLRGGHVEASTALDALIDKELRTSGQMTLSATIQPANLKQSGPARIVAFSSDPRRANFLLAQRGSHLAFRLLTTRDGKPHKHEVTLLEIPEHRPSIHLTLTYFSGTLFCYLDGQFHSKHSIAGDFSAWLPNQRLALGDESRAPNSSRTWQGTLGFVALYRRALQPWEVRQNHESLIASIQENLPRPAASKDRNP